MTDSPEQVEAKQFSINEMTSKLGHDERLMKAMIPDFAVGCRRPTPGNGYLEALGKENVRVVTDHISKIVPEGIKLTTGEVIKVDAFICATGFDISFFPRFKLIGRKGKNIAEEWKIKPQAYLSVAAADFPNYFSKPCTNSYYKAAWPANNIFSVLGPKRPSWARICPAHYRALYKVYNQHDKKDAGTRH